MVEVQVALAVVTCRVPGTGVESCNLSAGFSQQHLCCCCLGMHQKPASAPLPFPSTAGLGPFMKSPDVTLYLGESSAVGFGGAMLRLANIPWQRLKLPMLWGRDLTQRQCRLLARVTDDVYSLETTGQFSLAPAFLRLSCLCFRFIFP